MGDGLEEGDRVVVVDDVGGAELEDLWVLGVDGGGGGLVNFRILDYVGLAVLGDDEADGLIGGAFAHDLGADLDTLGGGEAQEGGVRNSDKGVVDTVGVDVLDSAGLHVSEDAGLDESEVDSAVSIWGDGNARFGLEEDLALVRDAGEDALFKEDDVGGGEAKVGLGFEEGFSWAAGWAGGHDVPWDGDAAGWEG